MSTDRELEVLELGNAGIAKGTEWAPPPSPQAAPLPVYPQPSDLPDTPAKPVTFEDLLRRVQRQSMVDVGAALVVGLAIGRLWPVVFP